MQNSALEKPAKIKDYATPVAINKESSFELDELIFSITDPASAITFANDVFIKISKYNQQEIAGHLHNLIRHPDMPRAVFHMFWEHLKQNKPAAAYVKNMAKDGSFYWAMALAFPCEAGYFSVRLKPGSELFQTIQKIYGRVLNHEKKLEKQTDKKSAIYSSLDVMLTELNKLGYTAYDEFICDALQKEMLHRDKVLSEKGGSSNKEKDYIPNELNELESFLHELVLELDELKQIRTRIVDHSEYILNLSKSVMLLSLNAQVGSSKLDQQDRSLSVVAEKMGEQSIAGENQLLEMQNYILQLRTLIGELNFDVISTKFQVEMTKHLLFEIEENNSSATDQFISEKKALDLLYHAVVSNINVIADGIGKLPVLLKKLQSGVHEVERFLLVLRFVHIKGKVEIARMNDEAKSFSNTFQDLIKEVNLAESRLEQLGEIILRHQEAGHRFTSYKAKLNTLGGKIKTFQKQQPETVIHESRKAEVAV